jgi:hypothetical protein
MRTLPQNLLAFFKGMSVRLNTVQHLPEGIAASRKR